MKINLKEIIDEYTRALKSGSVELPSCCPKCNGSPDTFKRHDSYLRTVKFILDGFVHTLSTMLVRWKCPLCKRTFAGYPPFLLPYKHYVPGDIEALSSTYLEQDKQTYRGTATCDGASVGYAENSGEIDERQLAPSTVWRWLSFLSRVYDILKIHCAFSPIAAVKYRSIARKDALEKAKVIAESGVSLYRRIFPHLATACS